jgi:hypothetical protein
MQKDKKLPKQSPMVRRVKGRRKSLWPSAIPSVTAMAAALPPEQMTVGRLARRSSHVHNGMQKKAQHWQ